MNEANCRRPSRARDAHAHGSLETLLAVGSVIALLVTALCSGTHHPEIAVTRSVVLDHGDSLWTVASKHPVPGLSTAQTADLIADMNRVSADAVTPGTVLIVPAEPAAVPTVAMR